MNKNSDGRAYQTEQEKEIIEMFQELQTQQMTYQDEQEISSDIGRLFILQDADGLKLRFKQIYKERDFIMKQSKAYLLKQLPHKQEKEALQKLVDTLEEVYSKNQKEFINYLTQVDQKYREIETSLMEELKSQIQQIQQLEQNFKQAEENQKLAEDRQQKAEKDRDEDHKKMLEYEKINKDLESENKKLRQNYEILKEHEMSVIRDCENRRQQEIIILKEQLQKEQDKSFSHLSEIDKLNIKLSELQGQLRQTQSQARLIDDEKDQLSKRTEQQINEQILIQQELSQYKKKANEDIELIQLLRQGQDSLKKEKQGLQQEILEIKKQIAKNEQMFEKLKEEIRQKEDEQMELKIQIEEEKSEKNKVIQVVQDQKEQMRKQEAEKQIHINYTGESIKEKEGQILLLQQIVQGKEQELQQIKAKQYDKVDIVNQLAEQNANCKLLMEQNKLLQEQIQKSSDQIREYETTINKQNELIIQLKKEIQQITEKHEQNLDQFEEQVEQLTLKQQHFKNENTELRDILKQYKKDNKDMDTQIAFWKDKCNQQEKKAKNVNLKIDQLENELRTLLYDRQVNTPEASSLGHKSQFSFKN